MFLFFLFFFFSSRRRHTRFSRDWSSDVCSSDLFPHGQGAKEWPHTWRRRPAPSWSAPTGCHRDEWCADQTRSEERRVGKECRSRWTRDQSKKNKTYKTMSQ